MSASRTGQSLSAASANSSLWPIGVGVGLKASVQSRGSPPAPRRALSRGPANLACPAPIECR
eukprot:625029-Heterocapsa_arctica.AAC.1